MGLGLEFMVGVRRSRDQSAATSRSDADVRVRHHALPAAVMHSVIEKGGIFNPNEWQ